MVNEITPATRPELVRTYYLATHSYTVAKRITRLCSLSPATVSDRTIVLVHLVTSFCSAPSCREGEPSRTRVVNFDCCHTQTVSGSITVTNDGVETEA